ncbi:hypothetical protein [Acidimangrovimonas pyrenivorans]|uniref:Uncharacterized protein n=1 Tax=Acidimangrovimonas pyrenivorans TaxID=2030798 RepID=A0ABV7AKJ2_9RHOB
MLEKIASFLIDSPHLNRWRNFFVRRAPGYHFAMWPAVLTETEFVEVARRCDAAIRAAETPAEARARKQRERLHARADETERRHGV